MPEWFVHVLASNGGRCQDGVCRWDALSTGHSTIGSAVRRGVLPQELAGVGLIQERGPSHESRLTSSAFRWAEEGFKGGTFEQFDIHAAAGVGAPCRGGRGNPTA